MTHKTGSTSTMKRYYYAGATRVAMRTGTSTLNYLLGDHSLAAARDRLGSQSITTNSSGVRVAEERYMPWGESRYTYGTTPTTFKFTGQRVEDYIKLYWYGSRWLDPSLARFTSADTLIPNPSDSQSWDRYAYSYGNPVKYTDPTGHWPCSFSSTGFSCSFSTFSLGASIDSLGEKFGIDNASGIVSNVASKVGLGLDVLAGVTDVAASTIVTTGIVVGGKSGAAITLPGGGTAIVSGGAGASVGWATTELGVRPLITAGNLLALGATGANVFSDLIQGDTGLEYNVNANSTGIELNGRIAVSSSSQVSGVTTTAGLISPLSYPSLALQTGAILGDLGIISPPPINKEFNLKWNRR